jgi:hypothetical protein
LHVFDPGLRVRLDGAIGMPIRDRNELYPANRLDDLEGDSRAHEASTHQGDSDRMSSIVALLERAVHEDHRKITIETTNSTGHETFTTPPDKLRTSVEMSVISK